MSGTNAATVALPRAFVAFFTFNEFEDEMITTWGEWKRYPRAALGETLESPIGPGIYEVRYAKTGALFAFGAVDNVAEALARVGAPARSLKSWFVRSSQSDLPDLEYRTCATHTKAAAKIAAERMIGRRDVYLAGAA
jgi:hypothetical protein